MCSVFKYRFRPFKLHEDAASDQLFSSFSGFRTLLQMWPRLLLLWVCIVRGKGKNGMKFLSF